MRLKCNLILPASESRKPRLMAVLAVTPLNGRINGDNSIAATNIMASLYSLRTKNISTTHSSVNAIAIAFIQTCVFP